MTNRALLDVDGVVADFVGHVIALNLLIYPTHRIHKGNDMANQVYPKFLEHVLEVSLNGAAATGANIKACLVTSGYTYNAAHDFLEDLGANITNGGYPAGASANLSTKTFVNGLFDADSIAFTSTSGDPAAALVLFVDPVRFDIKDGRWLRIERLKTRIKMSQEVRFEGKQKQVTISKSPSGKYYASILVETDSYTKKAGIGTVGVDLGITNLAILSDGTFIPSNQKLKESLKKLKKYQRKLSKKQKGSNRRAKAKLKVARIHARIANQRRATLHDLTDYLTRTYHTICIEDLNVKGMIKNRKLSRAISDAGFGLFKSQLEYKSRLRGNRIHLVNRFFPSSKMCSGCGLVKTELSLSERVFRCNHCGVEISRDLNAAMNLERTDQFKVLVSNSGEDMFKPTIKRTQELSKAPSNRGINVDGVNERYLSDEQYREHQKEVPSLRDVI